MPEISVIVPVYKVEPYLRRCVDSILAQTFTDFELILVDDGSPDNCGAICDEYARKDKRVRVIHQKNAGVSSARNAGIDAAVGQYIMFCDSDDYVSSYWCEKIAEQIRKNPSAWVYCDIIKVNAEGPYASFEERRGDYFIKSDYYQAFLAGLSGYVCNKAFSLVIIRDHRIRFDKELRIAEDVEFNLNYLRYCTDCVFVPQKLYAYVQQQESATHRFEPDKLAMHLAPFYNRVPFIGEERIAEYCDGWLSFFIDLLQNVFDSRNPAPWIQKMAYNQRMLSSKEFQFCLHHASGTKENPIAIRLLKTKCYLLYWLFEKAVSLRHRKDKLR